jgi:hypothetical protein
MSCSSLTSIALPTKASSSIGWFTFYGCSSLTSIALPSGITSIQWYAFSGCSKLGGSITIPSTVTSIGWYAFQDCYMLTSITLPSAVTSIGQSAFTNCFSLGCVYREYDVSTTTVDPTAFPSSVSFNCVTKVRCCIYYLLLFS